MSLDLISIVSQFNLKMNEPRGKNKTYEFESFRLDAAHLLLYQNGAEILVAPKVVETLLALVERGGEVLSKNELMEIVWADSIVEEGNLFQNLYLLRKILGAGENGKPLIETLRRRGYRFNGDVSRVENSAAAKNRFIASEITTDGYRIQASKPANAYQAYQLSRIHYHQITPTDVIKSRALLEEAVRLDANYAPAYAALAEQSVTEAIIGLHTPAESFAKAKDAIRKASDLNANSAEFYAAAGFVDLVCDWNFAEAERNLRQALEINSHCAAANNYLGQVFMFQRLPDEAEIYLQRSAEIEPMGLYNRNILTIAYFLARKYEKVIEECENTLVVYPQFIIAAQMRCWALEQTGRAAEAVREYEKILNEPHGAFAHRWIGFAYALAGRREKALETAACLVAESREHYVSPVHLAMLHSGLFEADKVCFYLEEAFEKRDPWMLWLAADPRFDNLRDEPRFADLMRRMNFE